MIAFDVLMMLYLSGIIGSIIGVALFRFPQNLNELEAVLTSIFLWPLAAYHQYNRELDRRAFEIHQKLSASLITELESRKRLLTILADNTVIQNEQYQELLKKYNDLRGVETPPTYNGESVLSKKGKPSNEPIP